jgi:uncharacterized protein YdaU (DUF1376 family)
VSKERLPWFPFFPNDFFGGTTLWSGDERGLYLLLLAVQWQDGALPSDLKKLVRGINYDPDRFAAEWPTVSTKFDLTSEGLVNRRLEEHRSHAESVHEKRSTSGRLGGRPKKQTAKQTESEPKTNGSVSPKHPHPQSQSQSTPIRTCEGRDARTSPPLSENEIAKQWRPIRDAYPAQGSTNAAYGEARRHCEQLVQNGATWPELLARTRSYARYCASTQLEPMSIIAFFGSTDEPGWLTDWRALAETEDENAQRQEGFH